MWKESATKKALVMYGSLHLTINYLSNWLKKDE
jgi:hypothetical protein